MEPLKPSVADLSELLARSMVSAKPQACVDDLPTHMVPVDVKETLAEYVVYADLPGVDEDEIKLVLLEGTLSISVVRDFDHDTEDAEEFTRIDRLYGRFTCKVPLGHDADFDHATAKYRRGVLKIRLPKTRML